MVAARRPPRPSDKPDKPRPVLVTGFDPFGGDALNPSWLVAQALHRRQIGQQRQLGHLLAHGARVGAGQGELEFNLGAGGGRRGRRMRPFDGQIGPQRLSIKREQLLKTE